MSNVPAVLKAELASLQRELERDPRFRRMRKIADLLADYEPPISLTAASLVVGSKERPTTKAGKIRQAIKAYMEQRGVVSRTELLEHLKAKGLLGIKEQRPLKTLGTYLFKGKDIWTTDGKGNWQLLPSQGGPI
jgi:hypothetical protein